MTVADLIAELEKVEDKTRLVVMSKDGEGNSYSPLSSTDICQYKAKTTWRGEIDSPEEPFEEGEGVPAFCMWPIS